MLVVLRTNSAEIGNKGNDCLVTEFSDSIKVETC